MSTQERKLDNPWPEKYQEHKKAMQREDRWTRAENGNRPDVFDLTSGIGIEQTVAMRHYTLLRTKTFDEACQEFHDYYFKELGYKGRGDLFIKGVAPSEDRLNRSGNMV